MISRLWWGIRVTFAVAIAFVRCHHSRLDELHGAALRVGSVPVWPEGRR